jgi:hypothetical protein
MPKDMESVTLWNTQGASGNLPHIGERGTPIRAAHFVGKDEAAGSKWPFPQVLGQSVGTTSGNGPPGTSGPIRRLPEYLGPQSQRISC